MNKINILIVEDDPIIAADLQDRLEAMGYAIIGPYDKGEEALEVVSDEIPDLVIMDIQLGGNWDGIETTNNIQLKRRMPVIFLTSNSDDATFAKAKLTNPSAFISKPFRGRDLMHAIELSVLQSQNDLPALEKVTMDVGQSLLFNDSIFIKNKDRLERYYFRDIMWVEADDYYCKLHTKL